MDVGELGLVKTADGFSGIRLEFQKSNAVVVEARPLSGRATACSPGRSEAEPWEGILLKSQARPLSGRATADRILLSPAQTTGGLG